MQLWEKSTQLSTENSIQQSTENSGISNILKHYHYDKSKLPVLCQTSNGNQKMGSLNLEMFEGMKAKLEMQIKIQNGWF